MKVAYFSLHYEGAESFISRQISEIADKVEVSYLCCTANKNIQPSLQGKLHLLSRPENKLLHWIRKKLELGDVYINFYNRRFAAEVKKVIEDEKPDIIHCQYGYDALVLLDNFYNENQKFVITFRGFDASLMLILKRYISKMKHYLSQPNVHTVFVCEKLKQNLLEEKIVLNHPGQVIYSNTNTDFYVRTNYTRDRARTVFIQISSFREKKGHYYTIQAFEEFKTRYPSLDFELLFVGQKDSEYEALVKKIAGFKSLENIRFLGPKNQLEIKQLLNDSHVFVHHSVTSRFNDQEGIPNAVMEAMSMEMPILTTDHSGIPELASGCEDVFVSREKDIAQYVSHIEMAYHRGYSRANRDRVVTHFSKDRFRQEILKFYESVQPVNFAK